MRAVWVPREHGAWSWIASPVAAGAIMVGPHPYHLLLLCVALGGYLCFHAASWWARMPKVRRNQAVRPMAVYGAVTAVLGIGLLALVGWGVLGWFPLLALPLVVAYALTLRGRGRSVASGLATALATAALLLVAVQPSLPAFLRNPVPSWLGAASMLYGYTAGTMFAVKSMIRERGSDRFLAVSIAWHAVWVVIVAMGIPHGLSPLWTLFFVLTTLRATGLPLLARRHALRPVHLGLVELGFTVAFLVILALAGV